MINEVYQLIAPKLIDTAYKEIDLSKNEVILRPYGLSTVEMAAAFSAFANSGVYNSPKMYTEVRDSNGETVLKNEGETHVAMKETTAYFMNQMLRCV